MKGARTPKTLARATQLLERYSDLDGRLAAVEEGRTAELGRVNAAADAEAGPLVTELAAIAAQLEPWWQASGLALAQGRKSLQLGGCLIGSRKGRPKLVHTFSDDDKAVEALRATRWGKQTTRVKFSLDRTGAVKLLQLAGAGAGKLGELGFSIDQSEAFFVERVEQACTIGAAA